ncbi:carbohydrate ABC transporter permease [Phaeacidiphilus oryzae]|uniref:carbohydrate ABC transporter permease n=1 Tax=Phaeacidiphilus oryzae TaxID=348818 RepID=UPI0005670AA7|nr:sugar ABC transporter permease [Phaeacidiphilus oryzae]
MSTAVSSDAAAARPPDRTGTAAAGAHGGRRSRRARTTRRQQRTAAALLIGPFGILMALVFLVPLVYAIVLSLFTVDHHGLGFGNGHTVFTGLRSYAAVLTDPTFASGFGVIGLFLVIEVPVLVIVSLGLALLLDSGMVRLRRTAQLFLFLPHAVPGIIAALIWFYLYTPGVSPVVRALSGTGLSVDFLGIHLVLPSLVNVVLWNGLGYNMVIFYAALQAIPREVIEASVLDGASAWRTALRVKIPMVRATVVLVVMFAVIAALQLYTEPTLFNQTDALVSSRYTPNMYIYDAAFDRQNYGLSSAAAVILLVVSCVLSYAVTRWSNRGEDRK